MNRAAIQARRTALATQAEQAKQQYAELQATLHELDRQICGMHGGLQELDALLALPEDEPAPDPLWPPPPKTSFAGQRIVLPGMRPTADEEPCDLPASSS